MLRVLVPESIAPLDGETMEIFGTSVSGIGLLIVTDTGVAFCVLFARSVTLAQMEWVPFVSVVESKSMP